MEIKGKNNIFKISLFLIACFAVMINVNSVSAEELVKNNDSLIKADAKIVHGTFTEYFRKDGVNYIPVASQYENTTLDFEGATNREPYPGINPNNGFRVQKTAYIKLSDTGTYRFLTSSSGATQIYVNDTLISPTYPYIYLQAGQVIKVKVVHTFPSMASSSSNGQYLTSVYWNVPSAPLVSQLIPKELLYTTEDLAGADIVAPDKLIHGVFTEYERRQGLTTNFIPVASQYEDATLDFSCIYNKQPYPGIDPAAGFQVKKTAYIKLTETGSYKFYATGSAQVQVYINDVIVQNATPIYLQAGQIIKVKTVAPFYSAAQASTGRYYYDLMWTTPSMYLNPYALIPKELLYTTPDLQGI
ncbi:hypothetical protein A5880_002617 [Enterococcus sp. 4G2_DIV0659]|uniref:PA14 domain-containing protein n=2 Tax=Candidatus Enterococcus mansonii TaxID=1834181 RepID=A0A242CJ71_9ENTE|nr:hypothetical protein [Enterococcus sp. 4G2_DIV0659]OTO09832.1 hypothetical protein A5880_000515 [Enterococcus sp. 4G2_DIV0659]